MRCDFRCDAFAIPASNHPYTQSVVSDPGIELHLLQNPTRPQHCNDSRFFILAQSRSPLPAFEATFKQNYCRQKECVYSLKIQL